jgi:hypothetical protein
MSETKHKIELSREELEAAAEREAAINSKLGKGEDGSFVIIEMNRATGEQTLISAPNLSMPLYADGGTPLIDPETGVQMYRWQALVFPAKALARSWVAERGELGYGYLILQAVESASGEKTPDELATLADEDASAIRASEES